MKCHLIGAAAIFTATIALTDMISKVRQEDLISAPRPEYPYEARLHFLQGSGSFVLRVRSDGTVARVEVEDSTGAPLLDQVHAVAGCRLGHDLVRELRITVQHEVELRRDLQQ